MSFNRVFTRFLPFNFPGKNFSWIVKLHSILGIVFHNLNPVFFVPGLMAESVVAPEKQKQKNKLLDWGFLCFRFYGKKCRGTRKKN